MTKVIGEVSEWEAGKRGEVRERDGEWWGREENGRKYNSRDSEKKKMKGRLCNKVFTRTYNGKEKSEKGNGVVHRNMDKERML